MKWAGGSTLTESTWSTPVRSTVRARVRIVGWSCGLSRDPCAASAIRRACDWESVVTDTRRTYWAPPTPIRLCLHAVEVAWIRRRIALRQVEQLLADGVHDGLH